MRRQRALVRTPKALRQLRLGLLLCGGNAAVLCQIGAQRLCGKVQAADQPQQALGRGVGFTGELVLAEGLQSGGLGGCGEEAGADLFDVAVHVVLDGGEGDGAQEVEEGGGRLSGGEEGFGVDALGGWVYGDVGEVGFEGVEPGFVRGDGGHDGGDMMREGRELWEMRVVK